MPLTTKAKTGGGGEHYYFRYPEGQEITIGAKLGGFSGVDWRGNGGYVVAPPSNHVDGIYSWEIYPDSKSTPLAKTPVWLLELINTPPASTVVELSPEDLLPPEEKWATDLLKDGVSAGERNDTCAKLAGRYLGLGMSEDEVMDLLLPWNALKNNPPLPEKEVRKAVRSIAKKEGRKRVAQSVPAVNEGEKEEEIPANLPEDEKRTILIESIGKRLGIPLSAIARMSGDQVKYIFEVNNNGHKQRIWMNVAELTSWNSFKNKIAALCRKMIPAMKGGPWGILVQRMMDAAVDEEPGPEATQEGGIDNGLYSFIGGNPPHEGWNDGFPFFYKGELNIHLTTFATHLKMVHNVILSNNELAQRLKSMGAIWKQERIDGIMRKFWTVSTKYLPEKTLRGIVKENQEDELNYVH